MPALGADYYEILGVSKNATEEDIKRAYRRLARKYHPDANNGDPEAEAKFKEITVAYETLRDPEKRRRYDMFGPEGTRGTSGFDFSDFFATSFEDIFEGFFNSPFRVRQTGKKASTSWRGSDIEIQLELDFKEAVFGAEKAISVKKPVVCDACQGTGASNGTSPITCPDCRGSGQVTRVRSTFLGQVATTTICSRCKGQGEVILNPCPKCRGLGLVTASVDYVIEIPPGVDDSSTLRLTGKGGDGLRGAKSGDLYVNLKVKKDPRFKRDGLDLITEITIPYTLALLGGEIEIQTLEGSQVIKIPQGVKPLSVITVPRQGVPEIRGHLRGDLKVILDVEFPQNLSKEELELIQRLHELHGQRKTGAKKFFRFGKAN